MAIDLQGRRRVGGVGGPLVCGPAIGNEGKEQAALSLGAILESDHAASLRAVRTAVM